MVRLYMLRSIFLTVWCCFCQTGFSQELTSQDTEESYKHRFTLILGHTHVPAGIDDNGNKKWLALGSWGFNYDYWLTPKWAIGLHNDIIIEDFEVEGGLISESETIIERNYPFASSATLLFKPSKHLTYLLGAGGEFAGSGSYFLTHVGIEYGWHLPKEWELSMNLTYDVKWHAYDSWTIGFGISKMLGPRE